MSYRKFEQRVKKMKTGLEHLTDHEVQDLLFNNSSKENVDAFDMGSIFWWDLTKILIDSGDDYLKAIALEYEKRVNSGY